MGTPLSPAGEGERDTLPQGRPLWLDDIFYLCFIDIKRVLRGLYPDRTEDCSAAARTTAWEYVNIMREIATAVGADNTDVWLACKQEHLHPDMEDNLVIAAAQRSGAKAIVTSDERFAAHAPVATFSLEAALRYLDTL